MVDTLATRAFEAVNTEAFAGMGAKGRLEAFAWEYCRTVSEASDADLEVEAEQLGLPIERLRALQALVTGSRPTILAEVLRIFGDREQSRDDETRLDKLLDDVLGVSGHEGTIPG